MIKIMNNEQLIMDLQGLIDFASDVKEEQDFIDYLADGNAEVLSEEEVEELAEEFDIGLIHQECRESKQKHVYALAYRLQESIKELQQILDESNH